jgi:hypothetical protein
MEYEIDCSELDVPTIHLSRTAAGVAIWTWCSRDLLLPRDRDSYTDELSRVNCPECLDALMEQAQWESDARERARLSEWVEKASVRIRKKFKQLDDHEVAVAAAIAWRWFCEISRERVCTPAEEEALIDEVGENCSKPIPPLTAEEREAIEAQMAEEAAVLLARIGPGDRSWEVAEALAEAQIQLELKQAEKQNKA